MASYRQGFRYHCDGCGHDGKHDVWLVADVVERPDLAELIRNSEIRSFRCDACDQPVEIDATLLVGRPGSAPALLFAPGDSAIDDQFRSSVMLLMRGWTGETPSPRGGSVTMPLAVLDVAVDRDIAADLRDRAVGRLHVGSARLQRYAEWLDHELWLRRKAVLTPAVDELLSAADAGACRAVVEAHPELLADDVDALLATMEAIVAEERPGLGPTVKHRRSLLQRCRELGVARAFELQERPIVRVEGMDQSLTPSVGAALLALAGHEPHASATREILEAALAEMTSDEAHRMIDYVGGPVSLRELFALHLADAITRRPRHAADLRSAIPLYQQISGTPAIVGHAQHNLGPLHMQLDEVAEARAAFERALRVRTPDGDVEAWAATVAELAGLLVSRSPGSDRDSVTTAVDLLTTALRDERLTAIARAKLRMMLASAWGRLGETARSIAELSDVLDDPALADEPGPLTSARNNLGMALVEQAQQTGRAQDWTRARAMLRAAVAGADPDRENWLAANTNLGIALFRDTTSGTPEADLDEAIALFERCLVVADRLGHRHAWANLQNNLANALLERTTGDRDEHVARAVDSYERAREAWPPQQYPQEWGLTTARLARALEQDKARAAQLYDDALAVLDERVDPAHWLRIASSRARLRAELDPAGGAEHHAADVESHRRELALFDRDTTPLAWARAQHDLGGAYRRLGTEDGLRLAADAYRAALGIDRSSIEWAQTATMLGHALHDLGDEDAAVEWLGSALRALGPEAPQADLLRVAPQLANLLGTQRRWDEAVPVFRVALSAVDHGFAAGLLRQSREEVLARYGWLRTSTAFVLAVAGRTAEAVETVEAGRARLLAEVLRRDPSGVAHLADRPGYQAYLDAVAGLTRAENASNRLAAARNAEDERYHVRAEAAVREDLRAAREAFDRTREALLATEPEPPRTDRTLVYFVADVYTRVLALIVHSDARHALIGPTTGRELRQGVEPADLIGGVAEALHERGVTDVTLIPCGLFGSVALHAIDYGGRCLLDEFTVSYAPSAAVLARAEAAARTRSTAEVSALVVTDPTAGLVCADAEAEPLLARAAHALRLSGPEVGEFLTAGESATHLHFAGHARSVPDDPLRSHLVLRAGRELTLLDLLEGRWWPRLRLVVASACETAAIEADRVPDEFVGLPAGFLAMGVPGFLGTLWPVDDFPAALLITRFYADDRPAPVALRAAQQWLRRLDGRGIVEHLRQHPALAAAAGRRVDWARRYPDRVFFGDPAIWAAHVFIGADGEPQ